MAQTLSQDVIKAAIEGFESQRLRIDQQLSELRAMLNGTPARSNTSTNGKGRTMSAEGRARIAEAQRKRWAASRGQTESVTPAASKPKRKLSAAGRAAIVAALKKRWAAKRAGSATAKPATAKKAASAKAAKRAPVRKSAKKTNSAPAPAATPAA